MAASSSSSLSRIPQIATPTVLVNGFDRFLILQPYGEGPAVEQDARGGSTGGGVPTYVAIKVRGKYSQVLDPTKLMVCLKCLYVKGPDNLEVNGLLRSQMNAEKVHSNLLMGTSFHGLPAGFGFRYRDEAQNCEFECIDLPYIPCSLYGWMSDNYFANGVPEDAIIYIMGRVLEALKGIHGNHTHGKICAAHVVRWRGNFFLSHGASVVDLPSDAQDKTEWPYAPVTSVWRWARAPELRHGSLTRSTAEGDIWMVGVLALELAYSGLRFVREDVNVFNDKLDAIVESKKLPANLARDAQTQHPRDQISSMFKSKSKCGYGQANQFEQPAERKFTKEFQTFVFKCLCSNPNERGTAARLCDDPYLLKCRASAQDKYSSLVQKVDTTEADSSFM